MGAPLDNAAGLQHEDLIAGRHALQSMGYKHNRAPAFEGAQCVQQKLLVVRIKRACGFIQDQKRRSAQQSPCYGNPLALTTREVLPTFSQKGVIPVSEHPFPRRYVEDTVVPRAGKSLQVTHLRPKEPTLIVPDPDTVRTHRCSEGAFERRRRLANSSPANGRWIYHRVPLSIPDCRSAPTLVRLYGRVDLSFNSEWHTDAQVRA
jgi:hypothetical protein